MTSIAPVTAEPLPAAASRARWAALFEALRYLLASVAALALDVAVLWFCTQHLAMAAWVGGAIAYGAGLVFIYFVSVRWVFTARTVRDARREFVVFALLGVVGLVLNSATLAVATSLGVGLPLAKAISAGIGFVANFASRKALLFTRPRAHEAA